MGIRDNYRHEREAEQKVQKRLEAIGERHAKSGEAAYEGAYGTGKLTRDQRKSQERHIPFREQPQSKLGKIMRKLI